MIENVDKIFFIPGDLVTIKHDLPNKPIMLVKGKETKTIRGADSTHFVGIKCFWFTTEGLYQEIVLNTKDIQKVENKAIDTSHSQYTDKFKKSYDVEKYGPSYQ